MGRWYNRLETMGKQMDEKELIAYKEGFIDGANLRDFPYGKDCYLFGYRLHEVLDIVRKHKNISVGKFYEVVNILYAKFGSHMLNRNDCAMILQCLEEHKLIRFEHSELKSIDIVDKARVEIRRNGKVIYSEGAIEHEATGANEGLSSTG